MIKVPIPCSYPDCDVVLLRAVRRLDAVNYCPRHREAVKREREAEWRDIRRAEINARKRAADAASRQQRNLARAPIAPIGSRDHLTLLCCRDDSWPQDVLLERHIWQALVAAGDLDGAVWRDQYGRQWTADNLRLVRKLE